MLSSTISYHDTMSAVLVKGAIVDLMVSDARAQATPCATQPVGVRAELLAATYYQGGLHCGEAVVRAVNELAQHPLPDEVFRMASGFCEGISGSRCTCGALGGGVMAMGLLGGRTGPQDPWEPIWHATAQLRERFAQDQGTTLCDPICESRGGMDHPARWAHCAKLVGRSARWVVEIAEENSWR